MDKNNEGLPPTSANSQPFDIFNINTLKLSSYMAKPYQF